MRWRASWTKWRQPSADGLAGLFETRRNGRLHLHCAKQDCAKQASVWPEAPWRSAYGMRNALAHGYYDPTAITHDYCGIDLLRVWTTVQNDLPGFAVQVRAMLLELDDIPPPDCPNPAA